jgi:hypothetical protein
VVSKIELKDGLMVRSCKQNNELFVFYERWEIVDLQDA